MTVDSMYSISVTSKFKLFYEDCEENEDPNDLISRLEAEAKLKSKTKSEKTEKKKTGKDSQKKAETREVPQNRADKPSDKKGKRPDKKDEKPPRFANRQNRDGENSGQREERDTDTRENSGPPRGRGGYRGDRGNRGGYRGRGGGYRGGRDGQGSRQNGYGPSDGEWNVQSGESQPVDNWAGSVGEHDGETRTEDRGYRGATDNFIDDENRPFDVDWNQTKSGRGGQGGYGRGGGYGGFSGRGGGGYRGGRGGPRGGFRNTGREYERHSGSYKTGVKPVDKRDGAGAHNWGTMKDDIDASAPDAPETVTAEWANKESGAPPTGQATEPTEETAAAAPSNEEGGEEEETAAAAEAAAPVMMTLDEYRAQQAKKNAELRESLKTSKGDEARKINDGQDAFKNMVRYQKDRHIENENEEEEEEYEEEEEDPRSNKIVIDVRFTDAPRRGGGRFAGERGGRGGRGGGGDRGRGGGNYRGRGGFRGGYERGETRQFTNERPRSQQAQIRLNDENDFPSLK